MESYAARSSVDWRNFIRNLDPRLGVEPTVGPQPGFTARLNAAVSSLLIVESIFTLTHQYVLRGPATGGVHSPCRDIGAERDNTFDPLVCLR